MILLSLIHHVHVSKRARSSCMYQYIKVYCFTTGFRNVCIHSRLITQYICIYTCFSYHLVFAPVVVFSTIISCHQCIRCSSNEIVAGLSCPISFSWWTHWRTCSSWFVLYPSRFSSWDDCISNQPNNKTICWGCVFTPIVTIGWSNGTINVHHDTLKCYCFNRTWPKRPFLSPTFDPPLVAHLSTRSLIRSYRCPSSSKAVVHFRVW